MLSLSIYIYIPNIRLLNSACLLGVCLCGRSRVSMCMYIYGYCRYCIYILFAITYIYMGLIYICIAIVAIWYIYIYIYVWYICMYCHYSSTQLCLPAGSVIVWTKSCARYIHIATIYQLNSACWQGVCWCRQRCYLIRVCVFHIYVYWAHIATICLLNSTSWQGVWLCGWSCVFHVCICIHGYCRYRIYILSLFDLFLCV